MAALIVLVIFIVQAIAEKRILLNDPDLLQSQIHALERKVEDVVGKYTDMSVKYADLSTKYNDISTKNNDLSTKYTDLTTKYNDQSIKYFDLSAKYNTLLTKSNVGGLFIRWGRKDCPGNNTELVYSGFAGGSWYDHTGAAAEFVCLPRDPDLTTKFSSAYAYIYGSEYDTAEFGHADGDDLPCSVCRSTVQSSVLMIPGKSSCYDGWTMQYHGDLVAGAYSQKAATQYICLDEHPEDLTAGQDNHNGKLFYPVLASCGSLACPPYRNGKYLTCVVCTK
ncbi:short-chain collagen C4-like [Crassostrea angulata]|uniref:short-chain collagen C4-like n=1 Tax=Magallana angulata TaxID=2784310 RepID=UPI0022B0E902|nr:short-chain collagen C4-like [Crassostrea angulata]